MFSIGVPGISVALGVRGLNPLLSEAVFSMRRSWPAFGGPRSRLNPLLSEAVFSIRTHGYDVVEALWQS